MNKYTHRTQDLRIRSNEDGSESRVIEGRAIVFNQESVPLWREGKKPCVEVIDPEAITMDLLDRSDIKLTLYHDMTKILGRSKQGKGTLRYFVDKEGVGFSVECPRTQWGDEALEMVRRGEIDGCSFMFAADYGSRKSVEREERDDKVTYRVRKIQGIYDFTLTPDPAYPQTETSARAQSAAAIKAPAKGLSAEQRDEMEKEINKHII